MEMNISKLSELDKATIGNTVHTLIVLCSMLNRFIATAHCIQKALIQQSLVQCTGRYCMD